MSVLVEDFEKKYPKNWVVMQNRIQQCFHEMSLDEKRILILASPKARLIDASEKDALEITAEQFANECGIKLSSAYKQMEVASQSLLNRSFSYRNDKGKRVGVTWVIRAVYEEGRISICFPEEVLVMLKELNKLNPFTKYKKEDVLKLRGEYSIDLYHLAKKYEDMKSFTMSLEDFKLELGLPPSYDRINNLKARALEPALKEINKKTDLNITYENVRRGRTVTGLEFKIKVKRKIKPIENINQDSRDIPPLTEKQINLFLDDFVNDPSIISSAPIGMSMSAFKNIVKNKLKDNNYVQKNKKLLVKVGYKY